MLPESVNLTTGEFPPYTSEDLPNGGMITEIIREIFKERNYLTMVEFLPWKRGYKWVLEAKYFGTFPYVKDPEREELFLFSESIYSSKVYFFVRADSGIRFEKDEDLRGLTSCIPLGYSKEETQRFRVTGILKDMPAKDDRHCFRLVKHGRIDTYAVNELAGWQVIRELYGNTEEFHTIGQPINENHYYLMVSRTHPKAGVLLKEFNQGLRSLKTRGILDKIVNKHMMLQ